MSKGKGKRSKTVISDFTFKWSKEFESILIPSIFLMLKKILQGSSPSITYTGSDFLPTIAVVTKKLLQVG